MKRLIVEDKKLCECGCGTKINRFSKWDTRPRRFANGHNTRSRQAQTHPLWKGGKTRKRGYIMVRCDGHPRAWSSGQYVYEHILVMEKHLGHYLPVGNVIHHKNGIRSDNRIENLQITTQSEHRKLHKIMNEEKRRLKV